MAIWLNGFNHLRFGFGFSLDPDKIGVDTRMLKRA